MKEAESAIVLSMIEHLRDRKIRSMLKKKLLKMKVVPMSDGGMGSLKFIDNIKKEGRVFGDTIIEAEYIDQDGIVVILALNLCSDGKLFELDIWKTDYSELKKWPSEHELKLKYS